MSRAINIMDSADSVRLVCQKNGFRISVLEALDSGGVRIVLLDPRDADALRVLMKGKMKVLSHAPGRMWPATIRRQHDEYGHGSVRLS